jgi:hypothetical protein
MRVSGMGSAARLARVGKGAGENREVSPLDLRAGCAASLEREGGSRGKQGFPRGTEPTAWMPAAEDTREART